jgi:hypothetical protein
LAIVVSVAPLCWPFHELPASSIFCRLASPWSFSFALGVGHMPLRAITASDEHVLRPILLFIVMCASNDLPSSFATGVGNNPDALAAVRGAHVGCRYASPLSIIPCVGQVSENASKEPSRFA